MAYQRDDIEKVRAASDLIQIAEEVTTVRKRGRSVMAICPFHQEKTPSLSIDPSRGLWHCFGCGASGDVFRFVEDTQGLGFNEAVELLARRAGIDLRPDPEAQRRRSERESLVEAVGEAVEFYHRRLLAGEDAGKARAYLRGRDYDAETVKLFRLGYAPDAWHDLVGHLRDQGVPERVMTGAGLALRSRQGRLIDRFRGRVMFPIYDLRGDPVGFGARLLEGEGPKYLNSPETKLYQKSKLLYGLHWSKSAIARAGYAVVVEGYTDVIALHQAGLPVAVATCGTALGEGHFDLLRRFAERVVLAFDADEAGAGASVRGFDLALPGDLDLRVALLPAGKDPADLVQEGALDVLREAVEESVPLLRFRIEQELARFDVEEPEARARAVRAAAPLVARHPDPLVRDEYSGFLARRTGVDMDRIRRLVASSGSTPAAASAASPRTPERLSGQEKAEQELLRLVLANHPGLRPLEIDPGIFTASTHREGYLRVWPAIEELPPGEPPDLGSVLGRDGSEQAGLLRRLAVDDRPLADPEELWARLEAWRLERRIEGLRRALDVLDAEEDPETYSRRFSELVALERAKREVGGRSWRVSSGG